MQIILVLDMKSILFNDERIDCADEFTLADLLQERGLTESRIAVAVNGKVIKRADWSQCPLSENADVVVIEATYGG